MCSVAKTGIMSCQLSFYPLKTRQVNETVRQIIAIISAYPLQAETTAMSTIVIGESAEIFAMLQEIYQTMNKEGLEFSAVATFSNSCGCNLA